MTQRNDEQAMFFDPTTNADPSDVQIGGLGTVRHRVFEVDPMGPLYHGARIDPENAAPIYVDVPAMNRRRSVDPSMVQVGGIGMGRCGGAGR